MENKAQYPIKPNGWSIAGFLLLLISVSIWILWINTFSANPTASQADKVAIFLSHFPLFMRNTAATSLLVIVSAIGSIAFTALGQREAKSVYRVLGTIVIILASLVLLLQLFTML